MKKISQE